MTIENAPRVRAVSLDLSQVQIGRGFVMVQVVNSSFYDRNGMGGKNRGKTPPESAPSRVPMATAKQIKLLEGLEVVIPDNLTWREAQTLINIETPKRKKPYTSSHP